MGNKDAFAEVLSPQQTGSANRKSANYKKMLGPQIAPFAEGPLSNKIF
jgi:hypothetical protein